jgi:predicted MFS family arabinose efflux permease
MQDISAKNLLTEIGSLRSEIRITIYDLQFNTYNLTLTTYHLHMSNSKERIFTKYQVFVIAILAILQFTIVLDFMVLSPLGAILMPKLNISPSQFGLVVSAYAFSAGASGLLAAGFADKFDRKKLLMFFYTGFILGTVFCALAPNYHFLLIARIVTGIFGGVLSSISFAIITDLFAMQVRGRVMGFVQMAFAVSQVMGLPLGLYLANKFGWHSPFVLIAAVGAVIGIVIMVYLRPVDAHLKVKSDRNALQHLGKILSNNKYLKGFAATALLSTGGFMLMPFASAFSVHNVGITLAQLPLVYMITGLFSMITGPMVGKLSDKTGKYSVFFYGSILSIIMVIIYTNLSITPLWAVIALNSILFVGISSRIISSSTLMTAVPKVEDRGAFMGVNASIQQISGGIASAIAGLIVVQNSSGKIEHYDTLGYLVSITVVFTIIMMYFINKQIKASHVVSQPIDDVADHDIAEVAAELKS